VGAPHESVTHDGNVKPRFAHDVLFSLSECAAELNFG
jgi:hypothetical protein